MGGRPAKQRRDLPGSGPPESLPAQHLAPSVSEAYPLDRFFANRLGPSDPSPRVGLSPPPVRALDPQAAERSTNANAPNSSNARAPSAVVSKTSASCVSAMPLAFGAAAQLNLPASNCAFQWPAAPRVRKRDSNSAQLRTRTSQHRLDWAEVLSLVLRRSAKPTVKADKKRL